MFSEILGANYALQQRNNRETCNSQGLPLSCFKIEKHTAERQSIWYNNNYLRQQAKSSQSRRELERYSNEFRNFSQAPIEKSNLPKLQNFIQNKISTKNRLAHSDQQNQISHSSSKMIISLVNGETVTFLNEYNQTHQIRLSEPVARSKSSQCNTELNDIIKQFSFKECKQIDNPGVKANSGTKIENQSRSDYKSNRSIQINLLLDLKQNICGGGIINKEKTDRNQSPISSGNQQNFEFMSKNASNPKYQRIQCIEKEIFEQGNQRQLRSPQKIISGPDEVVDIFFGSHEDEQIISRSSSAARAGQYSKGHSPTLPQKDSNPRKSLREIEDLSLIQYIELIKEEKKKECSTKCKNQYAANKAMREGCAPIGPGNKISEKQRGGVGGAGMNGGITKSYFSLGSNTKSQNSMKRSKSSNKAAYILKNLPLHEIQSEGEAEEAAAFDSYVIQGEREDPPKIPYLEGQIVLSFRAIQQGDVDYGQNIKQSIIEQPNRLQLNNAPRGGLIEYENKQLKPINSNNVKILDQQDSLSDCEGIQIPEEFSDQDQGIQTSHLDYDSSDESISPIDRGARAHSAYENQFDPAPYTSPQNQNFLETSQGNRIANRRTRASGGYLANLVNGGKSGYILPNWANGGPKQQDPRRMRSASDQSKRLKNIVFKITNKKECSSNQRGAQYNDEGFKNNNIETDSKQINEGGFHALCAQRKKSCASRNLNCSQTNNKIDGGGDTVFSQGKRIFINCEEKNRDSAFECGPQINQAILQANERQQPNQKQTPDVQQINVSNFHADNIDDELSSSLFEAGDELPIYGSIIGNVKSLRIESVMTKSVMGKPQERNMKRRRLSNTFNYI
ncbi:hypothetical protein FGO68_gene16185 [Halteria grandinella]|uniref:Uncharacterized protein n=1 Tax=Halteria grandinella TaxID=5974 RepID=A0A8J8P0I4_HALGN|nr:hypothetical protein FGO68_gene16185 [Halteria grandinella]